MRIKSFILLLTLLVFGISGKSQSISIGGKIGGNFTSFHGKDIPDYNYKPGIVLGFVSQFKASNHFYLQPELNYEQKGAKHKLHVNGYYQESTYKLNYIVLPVLAKFYFGSKEIFFINAGPYLGFLLKATERYYITNSSTGDVISDDSGNITSNQNTVEFGIAAGLGTVFKMTEITKFFIDARYNFSVTSINKENAAWHPKNQGFNFNLGLLFKIK